MPGWQVVGVAWEGGGGGENGNWHGEGSRMGYIERLRNHACHARRHEANLPLDLSQSLPQQNQPKTKCKKHTATAKARGVRSCHTEWR